MEMLVLPMSVLLFFVFAAACACDLADLVFVSVFARAAASVFTSGICRGIKLHASRHLHLRFEFAPAAPQRGKLRAEVSRPRELLLRSAGYRTLPDLDFAGFCPGFWRGGSAVFGFLSQQCDFSGIAVQLVWRFQDERQVF